MAEYHVNSKICNDRVPPQTSFVFYGKFTIVRTGAFICTSIAAFTATSYRVATYAKHLTCHRCTFKEYGNFPGQVTI